MNVHIRSLVPAAHHGYVPAAFGVVLLVAASAGAQAPSPPPTAATPVPPASVEETPAALQALLDQEPTADEVLFAVERYLRLRPQDLRNITRRARRRALAPLFAVGGRYTRTSYDARSNETPTPRNVEDGRLTTDYAFNAGILWDLRDLAFNTAELDVYSVLDLRRRVLTEVSRTYLARRLMQIDLHTQPLDARTRLILEARIAEATAALNAVSGGWFADRLRRAPRNASTP